MAKGRRVTCCRDGNVTRELVLAPALEVIDGQPTRRGQARHHDRGRPRLYRGTGWDSSDRAWVTRRGQRICIGTFTGPAGTFHQRTEIPKTARNLLTTLRIYSDLGREPDPVGDRR